MANPLDQWKSLIISLPEESFFEIVRNYLGELKTPFNKHSLAEELAVFLQRETTMSRIIALIDIDDAVFISAVSVLGEPESRKLFNFFEKEKSYLELHHALINLEERLILYRDSDTGSIRINPLLRERLEQDIIDPNLLFPSKKVSAATPRFPWFMEQLLPAFASFLWKGVQLYKSDGGLRRKAEDELLTVFPSLKEQIENRTRMEILIETVSALKFLHDLLGNKVPPLTLFKQYEEMEKTNIRLILWGTASLIISGRIEPTVREIEERIELIAGFLEVVPENQAFSMETLRKMLAAFIIRENPEITSTDRIIDSLIMLELLLVEEENFYRLNPAMRLLKEEKRRSDDPAIVVEPNLSIVVKPWISFVDEILVAASAEIELYDIYPRFSITKHSFMRALGFGYSAVNIIETITRLNGKAIPQNVNFNLSEWEKEFQSIKLYTGAVIIAGEEKRHLIEHSNDLKKFIKLNPAPGVFLFSKTDEPAWRKAFKDAGIDILPESGDSAETEGSTDRSPACIRVPHRHAPIPFDFSSDQKKQENKFETGESDTDLDIFISLHEKIKSLPVSREEREEYEARLRKKLILFPEQLRIGIGKREKTEVKGIDYMGKIRLIEQTIAGGNDLLEVIERTSSGSPRRLLLKPIQIKKTVTDLILYGKLLPEEDEVRVLVRKIGHLKRLKSSLYLPNRERG